MIRTEPKVWNLLEEDRVNLRPYEDAQLVLRFESAAQLDALEFRAWADQDPWPAQHRPYSEIESVEWEWGNAIFIKDGQFLRILIPWSVMETWVDVKMEFQVNARQAGDPPGAEFCVVDANITVARGE